MDDSISRAPEQTKTVCPHELGRASHRKNPAALLLFGTQPVLDYGCAKVGDMIMANKFKRGESVRFKTTGAGVTTTRRGTVVKTVPTVRGTRVEVEDKDGHRYRPHLSAVKLAG